MEEPGEPEAHHSRTPSPSLAPGHLKREKLPQDPLYDIPGASGDQAGGPQWPTRTVSLRERLLLTRPVWLQLRANAAAALHMLRTEPPGTFLVRKSNTRQCQALCVRLPEASGPSFVSSHYIQESPGGVSLEGSELMFSDLVQLICAYCHTRDILLLPLRLPTAIQQAATHKQLEAISHLGIEFWSSSLNTKAQQGLSEGPPPPRLKARSPHELDQGTGAALCFFNPLFPGDLGPTKREKFKRSFKVRVSTETSSPLSPPAVPPPPVPVLPGASPSHPEQLPPHQLLRRESSVGYRVPGGTSPSLPPLPSLQEVECGSPSSSEEEGPPVSQGSPSVSPSLGRRWRRQPLLRSMSAAFCSLLAPERQVVRAAAALVQDRHTVVGQLVQDLLTQVRAGHEPQELQSIRQALSRAQAMLSAELGPEKLLPPERLGKAHRGSLRLGPWLSISPAFPNHLSHCVPLPPASLMLFYHFMSPIHTPAPAHCCSSGCRPLPLSLSDLPQHFLLGEASAPSLTLPAPPLAEHVLEKSLHRSVLKPLRPILAARLRRRLCADGSLGRLAEGLRLARAQGPRAFGSHLSLPSLAEMEQIRQKLLQLLRTYSPSAQVKRLLQACKLLYTTLRTQAGESAGADEFLPLLSLVLAQCDLPDLLLEAEYMTELLEPSLLTGEGGYYLTSLSASLALLSSLGQAHTLPLSPAQELQRSLRLWEERCLPATHSFQHLLRVAYQDPSSGCTSKTLAVPPGASITTLKQLCATKFRVTQPDAFGLFLYKEQSYHRLPPGALAHRLPTACYLVYRRAERSETQEDARQEMGSGCPETGSWEEKKEGQGEGRTGIKASPKNSGGEYKAAEGGERQVGGSLVQPGEPKTQGNQSTEE
ncbi:ras and Rab interactor 1 isoform X2 [Fukomys damarensis]|uniref:ras and Rab interactor 1 isoform X2 n=1 Tax=Fukomys damarensis TaxID=885580 RepID=UPI00053F7706|nr:ras and Rab interactor 1 isoform X2 [Fukomys damarensis]